MNEKAQAIIDYIEARVNELATSTGKVVSNYDVAAERRAARDRLHAIFEKAEDSGR